MRAATEADIKKILHSNIFKYIGQGRWSLSVSQHEYAFKQNKFTDSI